MTSFKVYSKFAKEILSMKNAKRFAALFACLILVVAMFTACSGKFENVGAYLQDEEVAQELEKELANWEGSGITMNVYADGNTLVYACAYDTQLDLSDETLKQSVVDALEAASEEQRETYEDIAEALRTQVKGDDIKVRLVYSNADGSEIYSCEFE